MAPPTLLEMATRTAIRNIPSITSVVHIRYDLLKPLLKKITNPKQLRLLEMNGSQIAEYDEELWRNFIARDIPGWQEKIFEPEKPNEWWKVYRNLIYREKSESKAHEEALRQRLTTASSKQSRGEVQFVEKVLPLPRKQSAYVDGKPNPRLTESGAIRKVNTRNARNGSEYVRALRREGATAHKIKAMSTIKPRIPDAKSQIQQAPQSMVDERLKQRAPLSHNPVDTVGPQHPVATKVYAPKGPISMFGPLPLEMDLAIQKRIQEKQQKREEQERKALMQSKPPVSATADTPPDGSEAEEEGTSPIDDPLCLMGLWTTNPVSPPKPTVASTPAKYTRGPMRPPTPRSRPPVVIKKHVAPASVFLPGKKRNV